MSFPNYPAYKDSGVEWLGEVPQNWSVYSLKRTVDGCVNGLWGDEPDGENDIAVIRVADFERSFSTVGLDKLTYRSITPKERQSRLIKSGDLLIEKSGGGEKTLVGCVVLFTHEFDAITSNFVARMRPLAEFDSQFLCYAFGNLYQGRVNYPSVKQVTGIQNLDAESYLQERFCFPTRVEQTQIARFLDHETARIDALIEEQQRLIELLKEKRQAVISHAVTKGLDPAVPMKESGVEWLGEVPAHWAIKRLKQLVIDATGIQMGPFGGMLLELDESDTGYKVFGQENTISGNFSSGNRWISEQRYFALSNYHLEVGDIVLTRKGSLGNCRRVSFLPQAGIIDSDTIRVRAKEQMMSPDYLELLLHEAGYISTQLGLVKRGAILSGLNSEIIANLVIVAPPRKEQEELLREIKAVLSRFDQGISDCEYAVGLLRERRSALISAAVTGKIDVRGWQPPASTQAPELAVAEAN